MLWQSVGLDFEHGVPRNLCLVFTRLLMKTVIFCKMKRKQAEGSVSTGVRYSKRAPRVWGIINLKICCSLFRKLLMTSAGSLTEMSLTNSLPQRRNLLLALMEFRTAFTDVREDWVRKFCLTCIIMCWKVVLFLRSLRKVEQSLSQRPQTSTTMEGLLDHHTHFAHWHCNCECKLLTTAICRGLHWYSTQQKCIEMDELAQQDHTYRLYKEEFKRYQG